MSQQKKHFLLKVHLDKKSPTRNNREKWCPKLVCVIYIIYITVLGRTDFEHPIFSIILSQSCFYRDGPLIKNVSFVKPRKKCYIFKIGEQSHFKFARQNYSSQLLSKGKKATF